MVELARLVASLARTRVTSAQARIVRYGLKARLRAVGCLRGRRAVAFQLRRRPTRMCSAAAPSRNARRGTWVGGAADGRGARARGCCFAAVPLAGGRCVVSSHCGLPGAARVACDAAHVRACHPPHRPASQDLFECACFPLAGASVAKQNRSSFSLRRARCVFFSGTQQPGYAAATPLLRDTPRGCAVRRLFFAEIPS